MIQFPIKYKDQYELHNIKPIKGILLYGPPGNSKTLMAKAVANNENCNFISVKCTEFFQKYVGDGELLIRNMFDKARKASPSLIFIDEIDAIALKRQDNEVQNRLLIQLLHEMDGIEELNNVFIIAATNRIDQLDQAILRPGRFDLKLQVNNPNFEERKEIVEIFMKKYKVSYNQEQLELISNKFDNYSGAEIENQIKMQVIKLIDNQIELTLENLIQKL